MFWLKLQTLALKKWSICYTFYAFEYFFLFLFFSDKKLIYFLFFFLCRIASRRRWVLDFFFKDLLTLAITFIPRLDFFFFFLSIKSVNDLDLFIYAVWELSLWNWQHWFGRLSKNWPIVKYILKKKKKAFSVIFLF